MTYNGWTNYETWAVGMFLDGNYDDASTYYAALEVVRDAAAGEEGEGRLYPVSSALEEFTRERVESDEYDGLRGDLLGAALSEVDWRELAEAQLTTLDESE